MSSSRRLTAKRLEAIRAELAERWPLIGWWLRIDRSEVDFDYFSWFCGVKHRGVQGEELAAAYEQQIAYYQWKLEQRVRDRLARHLVEKWTDSMTYCCRRSAAIARGDDPGEWVDQHVRRPDLAVEGEAIVDEIMAKLDPDHECDRHLAAVS
jgi:hypothetical protein